MTMTKAYAAPGADKPLGPHEIQRREPRPTDVEIDILFCGVCHSDLHTVRNEWKNTTYPCIPGHEVVGRVSRVGSEVRSFKPGDLAGVGCLVGSCRKCSACQRGLEQYCDVGGMVFTYNSRDTIGPEQVTYGGYSTRIVVDQHFVLRVSDQLDLTGVGPLLCAGITTYSPLRHWKVGPGQRVGIVGLGGLGHMGLKFARAFGAEVTLFTTSPGKEADARRLGADEVIISKDASQMKRQAGRFDFILNTVAAKHDLDPFLNALKLDGTMVLVGAPEHPHPSPSVTNLIFKRRSIAGSLIGGLPETQEMLDFCAKHNIVADVEIIRMEQINEAYERMLRSDVKYRFVIDLASLRT